MGTCKSCGDPATEELNGSTYCHECWNELANGKIAPLTKVRKIRRVRTTHSFRNNSRHEEPRKNNCHSTDRTKKGESNMRTEPLTRICEQEATTAVGAAVAAFPLPGTIASLLDGAKLEAELQSSITTDWRVAWSPQECARDLFQNFRDANANALDRIKITAADGTAIISAPASMHLEHAFFLGSTKSKEAGDIGQFGEGLKVSMLCLLRDCGADIALASGNRAVRIQLGEKIPQVQLRPMVYRFFRLAPSQRVEGTQLILENVPANVELAVKNSPTDFFRPDHPLLGEVIAGQPRQDPHRADQE